MSRPVLVLRPQPGADRTAELARTMGLDPVVAPLFTVRPLAWQAPRDPFDALMLTSASAPAMAGEALASLKLRPVYAVGEATAEAARSAGLTDIRTGPGDSADLLAMMAADGIGSALHLSGREYRLPTTAIRILSLPVYGADPVGRLPEQASNALDRGAVAMLHSPRAAALFGQWVGDRRGPLSIATISAATAAAAGEGWRSIEVAAEPRDHALLEAAAKLCH